MRRLRYTSRAIADLLDIAAYISDANGDRTAGDRLIDAIDRKCRSIASLPGTLGRPRPELRPDLRSFPFKAHVIFFRYVGDVMEVVDVLDGRRDIDAYFAEE